MGIRKIRSYFRSCSLHARSARSINLPYYNRKVGDLTINNDGEFYLKKNFCSKSEVYDILNRDMSDIDRLRLVNEFYDIVNYIINRYGLKDYATFHLAYNGTYIIIEIFLLFYNKYFYLISDKFDSVAIINKFPEYITPTVKTNNLRLDIRLPMEGCEIILRTFGLDQKEDIEICQTHIDIYKSKDPDYHMYKAYIVLWCEAFRKLLDLIDGHKPCVVHDDARVNLARSYHPTLEKHHVDFMEWW